MACVDMELTNKYKAIAIITFKIFQMFLVSAVFHPRSLSCLNDITKCIKMLRVEQVPIKGLNVDEVGRIGQETL